VITLSQSSRTKARIYNFSS